MVMSDVVEVILLRCRANDLLRCKSVCKSWYSLISTPYFAKTHAKVICNKEEDNNTRKIAMITSYTVKSGFRYSVATKWEYYSMWFMFGSCNGLVCIKNYGPRSRIFVTNPVTREFRELQQPPECVSPAEMQCFGFGYDSSTDDYKLVMATCQQGSFIGLVRILSLKSNIWKLFGQVNYSFANSLLGVSGILFNGALHWFWFDSNNTGHRNMLLVSFDLAKEEFREIPQPNDTRYVWNFGYSLGIMDGRLCIYPAQKENVYPLCCGIWVMKCYKSYSWELIPKDREMKDHAIHYMLKDTNKRRITPPPTYYCDENTHLSKSKDHISCPMFVQTLVSPKAAGSVQEKREIEEVYSVEDKEEENKSCQQISNDEVNDNEDDGSDEEEDDE